MVPTIRHHSHMKDWSLDDHLIPYIVSAGLYGVSRLVSVKIDHALVTALVKQWRQETNTFHLPLGETTVTLQDVALFLGLRINGRAVTFLHAMTDGLLVQSC